MINHGYIKMPRLTDKSLTGRAISVLEYICENVRVNAARETELGVEAIGEMLTTRSRLMKQFRTTAQKIRSDLKQLVEAGYIEVETSARCSRIRVVWQDFALLNGYNIMLNNQANNQANNQPTTLATNEDSASYKDSKNKITNRITNRITNINNKDINKDYIHTQDNNYLVETKSAPARDTRTHASVCASPAAVELLEWMARYTPELLTMEYPLTLAEADELLRTHDVEDIRRILITAWSKKAYAAHRSTKVLCDIFLANDRILQQKRTAPPEAPSLMTYQEVLKEFDKLGGNMDDHFEIVPQPNGKKPLWRWKS